MSHEFDANHFFSDAASDDLARRHSAARRHVICLQSKVAPASSAGRSRLGRSAIFVLCPLSFTADRLNVGNKSRLLATKRLRSCIFKRTQAAGGAEGLISIPPSIKHSYHNPSRRRHSSPPSPRQLLLTRGGNFLQQHRGAEAIDLKYLCNFLAYFSGGFFSFLCR